MRRFVCAAIIALSTVAFGVLLALTQTMTSSMITLTSTLFAMGGTGHSLAIPADSPSFVSNYIGTANNDYGGPSGVCGGGAPCSPAVGIVTPEQLFPDTGTLTLDQSVAQGQQNLDACLHGSSSCVYTDPTTGTTTTGTPPAGPYVVYGYSQSTAVATMEKRALCSTGTCDTSSPVGTPSFILIANINRPNGGILERGNIGNTQPTIPFFGVTFSGATPTNTPYPTVDVARQYDGLADAPTNPLNPLADLNAAMGVYYEHSNYDYNSLGVTPLYQGSYGDTTYYIIPATTLPLLIPVTMVPVVGRPVADTLDPPLRVLVESAYDRSASPGQPMAFNIFYFPNPVATGEGFLIAIPIGLDNGISDLLGARPLGTNPLPPSQYPYGVGGPPVDTGVVCNSPPCAAPAPNPAWKQQDPTPPPEPLATSLASPPTLPLSAPTPAFTPAVQPQTSNPISTLTQAVSTFSLPNAPTAGTNVVGGGPTGNTSGGSPLSGVSNGLSGVANVVSNGINGVVGAATSVTSGFGGAVSRLTGGTGR
jgi:hypothetical protein